MRARSLLAPAAALVAMASAYAAGQPQPPSPIIVRWTAPASCPDDAALRARIERLLGGPPRAAAGHLDVTGKVEEVAGGFRLELTLSTGTSESTRILQGELCPNVVDSGALVIALAFDPEAVAAEELRRAEGAGGNGADPGVLPTASASAAPLPTAVIRIDVPLPPPSPTAAPVATPAPRLTIGPFAELAGDVGSLPSLAAGVRAGVALGIGPFTIAPTFEAWPSSKRTLQDRPEAGAELRLLAFALDACRRVWPWVAPSASGAGAFACFGIELGEMRGEGFGVPAPSSGSAFWIAPKTDLRAELPLARWAALTLDVGAAVPLDSRRFVLDLSAGRAVVHEPAVASGRASVGVSFKF